MERLEKFKRAAVECYGQSISTTEENAIEFDEEHAEEFRRALQILAAAVSVATTPAQLQTVQTRFRAELHDYRDATHEQIRRLRREVDAAASALEEFAGKTVNGGDDHEKELKNLLKKLEAVSFTDRLDEIRAAIRAVSAGIVASIEQMKAVNQLAIAQLKDEIRLLHQKVQAGRRASAPPPERTVETWDRQAIDDQIDLMLSQNTSFYLVLVVLRNLNLIAARNKGNVVEDAVKSLEVRLQQQLGNTAITGRWTSNQFIAILGSAPANAMTLSRDVSQKLMEPYSFEDQGRPRTLAFQVSAGTVDHRTGADVLKFRARLEQMSTALGGSAR